MIQIINKIKKLFKRKWEEGYITQDQAKYLKVKGELVNHQIEHKSHIKAMTSNHNRSFIGETPKTYTIMIKVDQNHQAKELIRNIT